LPIYVLEGLPTHNFHDPLITTRYQK